jgi:Holliday junction resolvase-like predicted endonuclease
LFSGGTGARLNWIEISLFDPETLSANLSWQEFEGLAESAFQSLGFSTIRNLRFKGPRGEIDLLATRKDTAFAVDCKHWKRTVGNSTMTKIADMQIERCKKYLKSSDLQRLVPIILTWHDEQLCVLRSGVPVVPINKISDFVLNWESSAVEIRRLKTRNRTRQKRISDFQPVETENSLVRSKSMERRQ